MNQASEIEDSEYYPRWLGDAILYSDLPWKEAATWSVDEFLSKYTLHDSNWVTLHYDVAYTNEALLVLQWDAVWLPDHIAKSTSWVKDWPLLFVRLTKVRRISTSGFDAMDDVQRGIATAGCQKSDGKKVLVINDHFGGTVTIEFEGTSYFLAFNRKKERLSI